MVFSLFNDQGSRNVSWYDCRDFCVNFKEGVLVQSRISGVVRQVKGMEGGEVRRVSRIAAEVLEWVGEVVGFKGGGGGKKNNIGFELG
ncbi:hypothetical protein TL16_g11950 [Triparma laevis f. inornata]|nr:hypothetical protein TL16_g11950 [Triparma laevis f. inornata]